MPFELRPDQIFATEFRVIKPLAAGGMGAVYVVEQLSTGKRRALKLMHASAAAHGGERRFEQEARTSAQIPSEHVVDVIAAGVDRESQVPWLAMELLEGESLEEYLAHEGALSPSAALELLEQIAHAIAAAHDIGIVHRDLKPDNIFLARARSVNTRHFVKVLDFGLAKLVDSSSRNTMAMGSPLWMAPEQTQEGDAISCATDVWALGLIVFRMLSGKLYWLTTEGSLTALLTEILMKPLPPASQRARELGARSLPEGFDWWFDRCVARDPKYRFQHARQAFVELQTVLSGKPTPPELLPTMTAQISGAKPLHATTEALSSLTTPAATKTAPSRTRWLLLLGLLGAVALGWLLWPRPSVTPSDAPAVSAANLPAAPLPPPPASAPAPEEPAPTPPQPSAEAIVSPVPSASEAPRGRAPLVTRTPHAAAAASSPAAKPNSDATPKPANRLPDLL
ncbi:MAG: serine/threonine protein kinase [Myxococcota bacterium]